MAVESTSWTNETDYLADVARRAWHGRKILPAWHLVDRWEQQKWRQAIGAVQKAQAATQPQKQEDGE